MQVLQGRKTYIIAALLAVLAAAQYIGYIDEQTAQQLYILLTGGGIAALRNGVSSNK